MSRGSPPVAVSRRRTSRSWLTRSTGWPPAASTRRRNRSTAGPASGSWGPATGSGPTRTTRSPGWPAIVRAVTAIRAPLVVSTSSWRAGPRPSASMSTPSTTSNVSVPSRARPRAPGVLSPGAASAPTPCRHAARDGVGGAQALRVDPRRRLRAGREVADQQGLAAARRSDHADPARARQRVVELEVDALAPQTGGQHRRNLSRRTPRAPDTSAVRGRPTYVSDLGRTTDALEAPPFGRADACPRTTGPIGGRSGRRGQREVREVAVEPGGPRPLVRRGTYAAPGVVRQGSAPWRAAVR